MPPEPTIPHLPNLDQQLVLRAAMDQREVLTVHAFTICRRWNLAEDAVQEALLWACEHWQDLSDLGGLLPWMRRVVQLKTLELIRREERSSRHAQGMDPAMLERLATALDQADADEGAGQLRAMKAALHHCMGHLSNEHQRLLQAFYWQQRSCEDLAEEFAKRPDNLRAMLSRLRKRLMRCMQDQLSPSPCPAEPKP
ncbi:MAG: sigma-70 family RNA polymerase sigma factor [Planctomycetota bacterium]|nr:MAG: sigma-70 family RNA polymerase sigma factor [Planctomycetota bacterium]